MLDSPRLTQGQFDPFARQFSDLFGHHGRLHLSAQFLGLSGERRALGGQSLLQMAELLLVRGLILGDDATGLRGGGLLRRFRRLPRMFCVSKIGGVFNELGFKSLSLTPEFAL